MVDNQGNKIRGKAGSEFDDKNYNYRFDNLRDYSNSLYY